MNITAAIALLSVSFSLISLHAKANNYNQSIQDYFEVVTSVNHFVCVNKTAEAKEINASQFVNTSKNQEKIAVGYVVDYEKDTSYSLFRLDAISNKNNNVHPSRVYYKLVEECSNKYGSDYPYVQLNIPGYGLFPLVIDNIEMPGVAKRNDGETILIHATPIETNLN